MKDIVLRSYQKKDAGSLMRMWRETAHLWPMGSPHPTELTPAEFHRRMAGTGALKHWVAEDTAAGRIVAYCAFSRDTVIPEHMEVSLINTHPDWQGRGIGKALLMKCIDATAAMGSPALFLGTWPGNEVACGLYKRIGFFHKPETDIGFVNFIPSVLQCPMLKPYLNRKNWYKALKRDTQYGPDDHRDGAMRVYPYRFETRNGVVEAGFERYSNGLYRVKTPDTEIALTADFDKGWKGFDREFTLKISGDKDESTDWSAAYTGAHGLTETGRIQRVEQETITVRVPDDLKLETIHPPRLQATVSRHGQNRVQLSCGFKPVEPVGADVFDDEGIVPAGIPVSRTLNLTNNLDRDITVLLTIEATDGFSVSPKHIRKRIPSNKTRGVKVTLRGTAPSAHLRLKGRIAESDEPLPEQRVPVGAWSTVQPAWIDKKETIIAENAALRFQFNKRRGFMIVRPRPDLRCAIGALPLTLGPPYPDFGADGIPAITTTGQDGRLRVDVKIPSRQFKGAVVSLQFLMDTGPLVTMESKVTLKQLVPGGVKLRQQIIEASFMRTTVLPMGDGIYRMESLGAEGGIDKIPEMLFRNNEHWAAVETRNAVAGCFWDAACPDTRYGSYFLVTMIRPVRRPRRGDSMEGTPLYFYAGPGNAETVRNLWHRCANRSPERMESRYTAWLDDRLLCLDTVSKALSLRLCSAMKKATDYTVELDAVPVLGIAPQRLKASGVSYEKQAVLKIPVDRRTVTPGVSLLTGSIHAEQWSAPVSVPVIACGNTVVRHRQGKLGRYGVHTLESGPLAVEIVPGWPGQIIGIRWEGIETLNRTFPNVGVLGFEKPFYGGLYPTVQSGHHNKIHRIRGRVKSIEETDSMGLTWKGLSLQNTVPKDHDMAGARIQCRYLLSPQLPILRVVVDVRNRTGQYVPSVAMAVLAPFMPAMDAPMTVHYESQGLPLEYRRGKQGESIAFDNFLTLDYGGTRPDLSVLIRNDRDCNSDGIDTGEGDFYLYLIRSDRLKMDQSQRLEFWIGFDAVGRELKYLPR